MSSVSAAIAAGSRPSKNSCRTSRDCARGCGVDELHRDRTRDLEHDRGGVRTAGVAGKLDRGLACRGDADGEHDIAGTQQARGLAVMDDRVANRVVESEGGCYHGEQVRPQGGHELRQRHRGGGVLRSRARRQRDHCHHDLQSRVQRPFRRAPPTWGRPTK